MTGRTVALRCDVGPGAGRHRLSRCLALAEELASRDVGVVFVCDAASDPWAHLQLTARRAHVAEPADDDLLAQCERLHAAAVVVDAAVVGADACAAVRDSGRPVVVVGPTRPLPPADVLVAPEAGADGDLCDAPPGTRVLAGLDHALLRNDVLANRPIAPPSRPAAEVPRLAVVLDEADAAAAPAVAGLLAATARPVDATFVVDGASARDAVGAVRPAPRQRFEVTGPSWRVHETVAGSDVVVAAAAASAYEWLCLGASLGLVWVHEPDVERYRRLMVQRVVVGLGSAAALGDDPSGAVDKASRLLGDPRERERLADVGWHLVDGLGRARVADALLSLV